MTISRKTNTALFNPAALLWPMSSTCSYWNYWFMWDCGTCSSFSLLGSMVSKKRLRPTLPSGQTCQIIQPSSFWGSRWVRCSIMLLDLDPILFLPPTLLRHCSTPSSTRSKQPNAKYLESIRIRTDWVRDSSHFPQTKFMETFFTV